MKREDTPCRCKFFKDLARAKKFAATVGGEVHTQDEWEFEVELIPLMYGEDYKEYDYVVTWLV